ncbi:peptidylprolyl isomerase [Euhalothece natronophila Z-M001]|uniref:Peptidyl-prolyl cis-trans isomerase n=1 Tax=Euhalothece natronophila Z-M001 TaxID=522448 RepID=A0A5B8NRS9_9CHRO|nr:peptidylprolyl isomerase [Euhalothece natronophila]QDZ40945.1 peptidylprolyl isomerase [Euhalothece natronophila Z-M001]
MSKIINSWLPLFSVLLAIALFLSGCSSNAESQENNPQVSQTNNEIEMSDLPQLNGEATVEFIVNGSPIVMEIKGDSAPITAGNFVDLVQRGFYDGLTFHRVVKEPQPFVVQGGDPKGNGTGGFVDPDTGQKRSIPLEILPEDGSEPVYGKTLKQAGIQGEPKLKHTEGVLSMARSQMPNSASSQFFITLADVPFLDGDYAAFGEVEQGMDVVKNIQVGDRIESATVTSGLDNLSQS